ncbi:helix-turn-helix domain-containing protein [Paenibacillus humicus]|uniref:helix-turn-helix domain-containing protein n=1 Tax=Paenibacillus humicus TaxID=412861 RepID=UPI0013E3BBCF|nr:helix-turn-helix transcriptional regulator [Paenibacillus humicus]
MKILVGRCRIRELRKARGWTQKDLSDRSSIGRTTLTQYETGKRKKMPLVIAVPIADALDVSPRDLFEWITEE